MLGKKVRDMKMFFICLAAAFILTLPLVGQLADVRIPAAGLLGIPMTGLGYMLVFFHELGHTAAYWFFGYPALPSFDFSHGGGYTQAYAKSWFILGLIWTAAAAYGVRLWQNMEYRGLMWLGGALLLHALLMLSKGDLILVGFAGHAGEVLVAAFCLLRAFLNTTDKARGAVERWLNMLFGCFVLVYDTIFTLSLMFHGLSRDVYAAQKGGHLQGDLDRVALALHIPMPVVAGFLLLLTWGIFAFAVIYGRRHAPHTEYPA